ncbi:MAG: hypothetical protein LBJ38_03300 [Oscillospiraceae bacterium]|jgi:hypothetical protein|nr:hypothetical protein [Oscillospiraceae bacterium]
MSVNAFSFGFQEQAYKPYGTAFAQPNKIVLAKIVTKHIANFFVLLILIFVFSLLKFVLLINSDTTVIAVINCASFLVLAGYDIYEENGAAEHARALKTKRGWPSRGSIRRMPTIGTDRNYVPAVWAATKLWICIQKIPDFAGSVPVSYLQVQCLILGATRSLGTDNVCPQKPLNRRAVCFRENLTKRNEGRRSLSQRHMELVMPVRALCKRNDLAGVVSNPVNAVYTRVLRLRTAKQNRARYKCYQTHCQFLCFAHFHFYFLLVKIRFVY